MVRGKLILICQFGGDFVTSDDGTMTYDGGDAHAIDVTPDTKIDDLKLKLAEVCNLEYKTVSIKYFLSGNKKTLITLSNDKDLTRMYDFNVNSVTAEAFVAGTPGFESDALNLLGRACGVKLAETPGPTSASLTAGLSTTTTTRVGRSVKSFKTIARKRKRVATSSLRSSAHKSPSNPSESGPAPINSIPSLTDATDQNPALDLNSSPADTVKKRRRTITSIRKSLREVNTSEEEDDDDDSEQKIGTYTDSDEDDYVQPITTRDSDLYDLPPEELISAWKHGITGIGQEFKSVKEFRDALQKYAIARQFMYRLKKNDTSRASGRCIVEGCSWRIHACWISSTKTFRIKKMTKSHTCSGESWKSAHPPKRWLVGIIKDRLKNSPQQKTKEIANGILRDFGMKLNYTQVRRGVENAKEQLQGSYKGAYNYLPGFCENMVKANPGSVIKLLTIDDDENKRFKQLFVSFSALIYGFQNGCRPLIFLDSTPLKSKYHEILLTATALDGNDGGFPVSFAIVDNENDENWKWFLEQLKSAVSDSKPITFVSDREKGLKKTVLEVFENAHHGYSVYHLLVSFGKQIKGPFHGDGKGSLPQNFISAAHSLRLENFRFYTEKIKQVSSETYDWVMEIEPECWTSSSFKGEHYNHIVDNIGGLYYKWIEEMRQLPIPQKVEFLTSKIMDLMTTRKEDSSKWSSKLTPIKQEKVEEETLTARGLRAFFSSNTLFEVHDYAIHVVDVEKWECTCLEWKITGLPCRHAIATFLLSGRNILDYCSNYFTVDTFNSTYSQSINPLLENLNGEEKMDSGDVRVLPPVPSRPVVEVREKRPRKKEVGPRRPASCSKCKQTGHYKATCSQ